MVENEVKIVLIDTFTIDIHSRNWPNDLWWFVHSL